MASTLGNKSQSTSGSKHECVWYLPSSCKLQLCLVDIGGSFLSRRWRFGETTADVELCRYMSLSLVIGNPRSVILPNFHSQQWCIDYLSRKSNFGTNTYVSSGTAHILRLSKMAPSLFFFYLRSLTFFLLLYTHALVL